MKRDFLKNLGIEDKDIIDKIMDENSSDIGKAKGELQTYKDKVKGDTIMLLGVYKVDKALAGLDLRAELGKKMDATAADGVYELIMEIVGFAYDAVTEYDRLSDVRNMTSVSEEFIRNTDKYKYEKCCDVISGRAVAGKECGGYSDAPLKDYRNKDTLHYINIIL